MKLFSEKSKFIEAKTFVPADRYTCRFVKASLRPFEADETKPDQADKDYIYWKFVILACDRNPALNGSYIVLRTGTMFGGKNKSVENLIKGFLNTNSVDDEQFYSFDEELYRGQTFEELLGTDTYLGKDFNTVMSCLKVADLFSD